MDENQTPQQAPAKKSNNTMMIVGALVVLVLLGGGGYYFMSQNKPTTTEAPQDQTTTTEDQSTTMEQTTQESTGAATTDSEATTSPATKEFIVDGDNFSFSVKEIRVKKGDTVRIVFNNKVGFHDWVVDEFNAKTKQIAAGKSETIEFVADKTGTFEYYCSVGSHRQNGMVGNLIVE